MSDSKKTATETLLHNDRPLDEISVKDFKKEWGAFHDIGICVLAVDGTCVHLLTLMIAYGVACAKECPQEYHYIEKRCLKIVLDREKKNGMPFKKLVSDKLGKGTAEEKLERLLNDLKTIDEGSRDENIRVKNQEHIAEIILRHMSNLHHTIICGGTQNNEKLQRIVSAASKDKQISSGDKNFLCELVCKKGGEPMKWLLVWEVQRILNCINSTVEELTALTKELGIATSPKFYLQVTLLRLARNNLTHPEHPEYVFSDLKRKDFLRSFEEMLKFFNKKKYFPQRSEASIRKVSIHIT